jgi:hypothetical protein
MAKTWEVNPDGTYRPLTVTQDLLSESQITVEDTVHASALLREVITSLRSVQQESVQLVKQSRRERHRRNSPLRLVRNNA